MQRISEEFCKTVSIESIMKIAENAEEMESGEEKRTNVKKQKMEEEKMAVRSANAERKPVIAVAKDEAFCFYYAENIRMLEEMGADIKYFSPIHDEKLSEGCHALLFGGGYPELYAEKLSANFMMRASVKKAVEN